MIQEKPDRDIPGREAIAVLSTREIAILARLRRTEATSTQIRREVIEAPNAPATLARLLRHLKRRDLIRSRPAREGAFDRLLAWSLTETGQRALDQALATLATMQVATTPGEHDSAAAEEVIAAARDVDQWLGDEFEGPKGDRKIHLVRAGRKLRTALAVLDGKQTPIPGRLR